MFCFVSRVLHSKSVNAIPSSCMYNYLKVNIGGCFYNEGISQNHAFKL
jgi:hypothetical protein